MSSTVERVLGYADAASEYLNAGWNPIPTHPTHNKGGGIPRGYTGYRGKAVDADDVDRWSHSRGSDSVSVRMPSNVVGIDIDQYDGKRGDDNIRQLEQQLGELPPTWASTSRPGTRSGIYFYRIPVGVRFPTGPCDDVEFIQAHHRHAVVWPSIHREGRQYRWYDDAGEQADRVPDIDDLAELPWDWVEHFQRALDTDARQAATPERVAEFIAEHIEARFPAAIKGPLGQVNSSHGSRHDSLLTVACWAMREAAAGYYPAEEAVDQLHSWWASALRGDSRLTDTDHAGVTEFGNAMAWAVAQVDGDPERIASLRNRLSPEPPPNVDAATGEITLPAAEVAERRHATTETGANGGDSDMTPESFRPVDLRPVLAGEITRPEPTVLRRDDRQALFYAGQINGIHGDSGIGKGWVALAACVQQITAGRHVVFVDLEDVPESIVARLRLLGASDDAIDERFHYLRPTDPFGIWAVDALVDLVTETNASLLVLDSLGEAFGLDGVNEDKDVEVGPWLRRVARPLADTGTAVVLVDHATKAADNPLHPSGSKRKRAAIGGASYLVTSTMPLRAGQGGRLRLVCAKDRHGSYARGEHVANYVLTTDATGTRWQLYAPNEADTAAELPVELAARAAVAAVAAEGAPMAMRALRTSMTIKASNEVRTGGIELAVGRGLLVETPGPRNARLFSLPVNESEGDET